ncbi:MAG: acyl-CoA thioesterase [Cyanobacteria bacterium NC_groundwater_1444_Ag_S-0.65um_54_12]|nr:acyl-CoA thioesterase [Cyanobacteria bacterium NC_groundwater_1444_Ag_S-0.65um_54_12]
MVSSIGQSVSTEIRVRYAEIDGQRVAHHAVYLVWFEAGRAAFLRARGVDYLALEASGKFMAVVSANVCYRAPAHYDDLLTVATSLVALLSRAITFTYRVFRGAELLATGETRLVMLDNRGAAIALPAQLRAALSDSSSYKGDANVSPLA